MPVILCGACSLPFRRISIRKTTEYPISQPLAMQYVSRYSAVLSGTLKVGPNVA